MDHEDQRARPIWLNAAGVRSRLAAMALLADLLERSAQISAAAVAAAAEGDPDGWLAPGTERSASAAQRVRAQVAALRALLRDTEATLQAIEQAARQPLEPVEPESSDDLPTT